MSLASKDPLVLFVHGYTGISSVTWEKFRRLFAEDKKLNEKFGGSKTFSYISYGVLKSILRLSANGDALARALKTEIDTRLQPGQCCILVCHSFGSLIAIRHALNELETGSTKVLGILSFGPPYRGSGLAKFAPKFQNRHLSDLTPGSEFLEKLNNDSNRLRLQEHVNLLSVFGTRDRVILPQKEYYFFENRTKTIDAGHIELINPRSQDSSSYRIFRAFLFECLHGPVSVLKATSIRPITKEEIELALQAQREEIQVGEWIEVTILNDRDAEVTDPSLLLEKVDFRATCIRNLRKPHRGELFLAGLIRIPIAVAIGSAIHDSVAINFLEYDNEDRSWELPKLAGAFQPLESTGLPADVDESFGRVALKVSVSFSVRDETVSGVHLDPPIGIVSLHVKTPGRGTIRSQQQILSYGVTIRKTLDRIREVYPNANGLDIFYSGPVSLAMALGHQISTSIHPPAIVWNYSNGYNWGIDINAWQAGKSQSEIIIFPTT